MKMITKTMGLALGLAAASVMTLPGCGGSSSSTPVATAYNGVFVDSGAAGVTFECAGVTGTTTAPDGFFGTCPANSVVTFSIGQMVLGSSPTTGDGIFFVTDIVGVARNQTGDADVLKIAVLLQSLDTDGDPSNGITVAPEAATLLPAGTATELTPEAVVAITSSTVTTLQADYPAMVYVPASEAEANLEATASDIVDGTIPPPPAPTGSNGGN